jgi:hypothetical protein
LGEGAQASIRNCGKVGRVHHHHTVIHRVIFRLYMEQAGVFCGFVQYEPALML